MFFKEVFFCADHNPESFILLKQASVSNLTLEIICIEFHANFLRNVELTFNEQTINLH